MNKFPVIQNDYTIFSETEHPKNDILICYDNNNDSTVERVKSALPQWFSSHVKGNFCSMKIKTCLDNTGTSVIVNINREYELNATCQADMIHIFKRQFPLVLVISDREFKPTTDWLNIVWNASTSQKVFLHFEDFENLLRNAIRDAQWNLSPNLNISERIPSNTGGGSNCFLGGVHEWTVAYSNPAQVSQNYRQLISDPLRIATDIKLQNIYHNYVRTYCQNPNIISLCEKAYKENDMYYLIRAYTHPSSLNATLNDHLAANLLYYFEPTLHNTVDYELVKCLIDFVTLFIYRQELCQYAFTGTVYRGVVMSEADLFKYVVGSRIMNTTFLSTSKYRQFAELSCGQNQREFAVLFTVVIHNTNNRRTALNIEHVSWFPQEREVLILPLSAFYVQSVKRPVDNSGLIEIILVEDDLATLEDYDLH